MRPDLSSLHRLTLYGLCILGFLLLFGPSVFSQGKGVGVRLVSNLPSENKRWALIIGVDKYREDISQLQGSVNDAKALRDVLVNYAGFPANQVILLTTDATDPDLIPNRGNIIDALDKLSRQIPDEGLLLFSFSGHGVSIGSDAFLIPSDGRVYDNAELLRERSIDVGRIRKAIEATRATQVLMLLDACRNDPRTGKGDAPNRLTAAYNNGFSFDTRNKGLKAFATLYATSFGDRAFEFYDKPTRQYRGFFSYAIEEGLKGQAANEKGEITLGGLISYIERTVRQRVYVEKNQTQIPYPITEGYKNAELVLALSGGNNSQPPASAWSKFRETAQNLLKYDEVYPFSDGFAEVKLNGKYGFIDKTGREIIALKYDGVDSFTEGLAGVRLKDKWGFIDKAGREVIAFKYDENFIGYSFSEGLASAGLNGKWGFIDKTGRGVIAFKYDGVSSFIEGLAGASLNHKLGFIDKTGREAVPIKYDDIWCSAFIKEEGFIGVELNGKKGFVDFEGNEYFDF